MIIGLSGFAGSGKDTLAQMLAEREGFVKMSFAEPMRKMLYELNPIVQADEKRNFFRLQTIIDDGGWDFAKRNYKEIRELLQRLGTESGRNVLGENVWVDYLFEKYESEGIKNLVIPDVRFPNEARKIWSNKGYLIRVVRSDTNAVNNHKSESSFYEYDCIIKNDGTPEDMFNKYKQYLGIFNER